MTPEQLAAIQARLAAATPGPWGAHLTNSPPHFRQTPVVSHKANDQGERLGRFVLWDGDPAQADKDALLIANAPADDCHPAYRDLAVLSGRVPEAVVFLCLACRTQAVDAGRSALPNSPYLWLWVGAKMLAKSRNRWLYVAPADEYVRSRMNRIKSTRRE